MSVRTSVTANGKPWKSFDRTQEVVRLHDEVGLATVVVRY